MSGEKAFDISKGEPLRIGLTMGDPAGIGPEIVVKAICDDSLMSLLRQGNCGLSVFCDFRTLERAAQIVKIDKSLLRKDKRIDFIDLQNVEPELGFGKPSSHSGKSSYEYIENAVMAWKKSEIDALVTAPISKEALKMAGIKFPGHTELLAWLLDAEKVLMSFFAGSLRTVLLSTHLSLAEAIKKVKRDNLKEVITLANTELNKLLGKKVRLAVAGLNPHASENGLFGKEEQDEILPAIEHCQAAGIDVSGPYPADTIFLKALEGEFDAVVAMYHDQATIPVKTLAFKQAVNVTLGLGMIRTSVDHGTAYDIAGKGVADHTNLVSAISLAIEFASIQKAESQAGMSG
ncbi:MAG TPA: 4-hydroxythreonine-4-phosphate dehydrogenase PdxA [Pyrinomonadaceae bacterium]|nr:4-hydroxythreonine-4-phosphate dehydrogenase PdxA [Pyrinomonadaceae bacterium]